MAKFVPPPWNRVTKLNDKLYKKEILFLAHEDRADQDIPTWS